MPTTPRTDGDAHTRRSSSIRFRISEEAIERFSALTGDRSSLHVSEAFARRSAYRRPVAHGMLPLGYLAALSSFRVEGRRCVPVAVTGRFVSPVYAGDLLALTVEPRAVEGKHGEIAFDYRVEQLESGRTTTLGTIAVALAPRLRPQQKRERGTTRGPMLLETAEPSSIFIEQLEVGRRDAIEFKITEDSVEEFIDMLALGMQEEAFDRLALQQQFEIPALLAVLAFSTSVGVSLPGAFATFLEFSADILRAPRLGDVYRLLGEVTHRSMATKIVKKKLAAECAGQEDDLLLRGKVTTLVSKPSARMPTLQELGKSAVDLGLKHKVVLVTGASRGIGETTAKLFALAGARVIVNYHRGAEDAGRIVGEITAAGGEAIAVAADITSSDDVKLLFQRGIEQYGTVDVLVNNAARDYRPIPFLQLSWEEVQRDLDVIAKGAFLCCRYAIPLMLNQGQGKVINISSIATDNPPPDQVKYVMAKSALVGLTRSLSVEFAARNIQVNLVVPNFVETDFVAHIAEGYRKKIARDTPMQRHASAVEVAQAVLFLASSLSPFITGQKIMVTGGGAPYL